MFPGHPFKEALVWATHQHPMGYHSTTTIMLAIWLIIVLSADPRNVGFVLKEFPTWSASLSVPEGKLEYKFIDPRHLQCSGVQQK